MSTLTCGACGEALALADSQCPRCGAPVAPERRRALMAERAETLATDGHYNEAARALGSMLEAGAPPEEAKKLWRKRSIWLQKSGDPSRLDEAEACLQRSVELDDADELGHQLWIDLLKQRGHLDRAKTVYEKRLAADPADGVATRQLAVIRSVADFLTAPRPKVSMEEGRKPGMLERWIKPTPKKMLTAGATLVLGLGGMVYGFFSAPAAPAAQAAASGLSDSAAVALAQASSGAASWAGGGGGGALMQMATDPWINGIQVLLAAAYLWWGYKERRG